MKRRSKDGSATIAKGATGRVFTAGIAVIAALLLALSLVTQPAAYAKGPGKEPSTGSVTTGQIAGNHAGATVLVYLNGSDLESEAGEATADIAEMLESGIGQNANVVIETLGTRHWRNYGIASDHTQRYQVKQGKLELVDDSLGQLDTTDPATLSDFISWGVENYPADRYLLLLWDHGAGPVYGFGYDEFQSDYAALTLDEMKQALDQNPGVHFDMIGMDCCIMGSLETSLVLQPYCDYTVLSEDFEPGIGWSYKNWMSALEQNPSISTAELGKTIVDDMISATSADPENGDATLALIDESAVDELYAAWTSFAYANADQLLASNYSQEVEWRDRPSSSQMSYARPHGHQGISGSGSGYGDGDGYGDSYGYGGSFGYGYGDSYGYSDSYNYGNGGGYGYGGSGSYGYGSDWYGEQGRFWENWDYDMSYVTMTDYFVTDIMNVASSVDASQSAALKTAFDNAVAYFGSTSGEQDMSGLAVTLPYGDAEFYDELVKVFTACGIDNSYIEWLEAFVNAQGANGSNSHAGWPANGNEFGFGDSYGYGSGNGYDDSYGYGNGFGNGDSYDFGYGNIDSYGYGDSYSPSDSHGNDYGNGHESGHGSNGGYGNGPGSSYSYGSSFGPGSGALAA